MRFYDYATAPSPRKVRLFIAEKGLSIPSVEVDLRARAQLEPHFLAKSPGATARGQAALQDWHERIAARPAIQRPA